MVMKSRAQDGSKKRAAVPIIPGRRSVPFWGEARPIGVGGKKVERKVHHGFISSSMARVTRARTNKRGEVNDSQQGPGYVNERAVGCFPEPRAPDVGDPAQRRAPRPDVIGVQARDGLSVVDQQVEVLPDSNHVRGHGRVPAPLADRCRTVLVNDKRRGPDAQGEDQFPFGEVAAVGRGELEPAIECRHQRSRRRGLDRSGVLPPEATGTDAPRVERRSQQLGVHPGNAGDDARLLGDREDRVVDHRVAVDGAPNGVPGPLPRQGSTGKGFERPRCRERRAPVRLCTAGAADAEAGTSARRPTTAATGNARCRRVLRARRCSSAPGTTSAPANRERPVGCQSPKWEDRRALCWPPSA